jgi:hypothetical protein
MRNGGALAAALDGAVEPSAPPSCAERSHCSLVVVCSSSVQALSVLNSEAVRRLAIRICTRVGAGILVQELRGGVPASESGCSCTRVGTDLDAEHEFAAARVDALELRGQGDVEVGRGDE